MKSMLRREHSHIWFIMLITITLVIGVVSPANAETPAIIEEITFSLSNGFECTATNIPESASVVDAGFAVKIELYYLPETTFCFNKDVALTAYEGTENGVLSIKAGETICASDYVALSGAYSAETGEMISIEEKLTFLPEFLLDIVDAQYYSEDSNSFVSLHEYIVNPKVDFQNTQAHESESAAPVAPASAEAVKAAEQHYETGRTLYKEENFEEALTEFSQAADLNPQYADARYYMAITKFRLMQYEDAIIDFDKTIELDPQYEDAYYHKGIALRYLGKPEEAVYGVSKAIEIDPDDALNWLGRGDIFFMLAQYEDALSDYKAAEDVYLSDRKWKAGNLIRPYLAQGETLTKLGRGEEAAEVYAQAIKIDADTSASAHIYKAQVFALLGRYEDALKSIDKALEISPDSSYAYAIQGDAFRGLGNYDEARASYDKSIELGDQQYVAYAGRASLAAITGDYEVALAEIDHALSIPSLNTEKVDYLVLRYAIVEVQSDPAQADGIAPFWTEAVVGPTRVGVVTITEDSNVRAEGNAESAQVGKVKKGETYDCIEIADSGWYKIVLSDGIEGYVSQKRGTLVEG